MNKIDNRFFREITYIYWRKEAEIILVNQEEFVNKFKELKETRQIIPYSTVRKKYRGNTFSFVKKDDYFQLFLKEDKKYVTYSTNSVQDSKNGHEYEGSEAITALSGAFKARNDVSLYKAYGTVNESFKDYIPKQLSYKDEKFYGKAIKASSVDYSSSYASCMCGPLPDAHTAVLTEGIVDPTKEYPFAFYTDGGCAEYKRFDTRYWKQSPFFKVLFNYATVKKLKDVQVNTILMKASPYTMDDIWQEFYNNRKTDDEAKLVMSRAIGMMHTKKYTSYKYAHLAAICIARNNQRILDVAEKIGKKHVIQICVDGIIYNTNQVFGTDEKKLGNLYQEYVGCDFKISGYNKYIVLLDGECVKAKHGNCNSNIQEDKDIKSLDDQYEWKLVQPLKEIEEYAKTIQEKQS